MYSVQCAPGVIRIWIRNLNSGFAKTRIWLVPALPGPIERHTTARETFFYIFKGDFSNTLFNTWGCWDRAQASCDFGIGCHVTVRSFIHLTRSHSIELKNSRKATGRNRFYETGIFILADGNILCFAETFAKKGTCLQRFLGEFHKTRQKQKTYVNNNCAKKVTLRLKIPWQCEDFCRI
jgi:hypothetical protein